MNKKTVKKWDASSLQKIVVAEVLFTTFVLTLFYKPMHVLVNSSEIFLREILPHNTKVSKSYASRNSSRLLSNDRIIRALTFLVN